MLGADGYQECTQRVEEVKGQVSALVGQSRMDPARLSVVKSLSIHVLAKLQIVYNIAESIRMLETQF